MSSRDFSKGERGKFYNKDARQNIPDGQAENQPANSADYRAVREASLGLGLSMSDEIDLGREDRV